LGGFVYRPESLESALPAGDTWIYGLAGTLTLFDGFANINEYKAAKERRKQAYIERERAAMALMLEVLRAQQNLETAADQLDLARRAMEVASQRYADTWEKWQEGLMDSAGLLQEAAEKSRAQMHLMAASFQRQVSAATLLNVMGRTQLRIGEEAYGQ
jgi:outer membrane protein TolC